MNNIKPKSGHKSLRKGRVSLPNHAYLITTTTINRESFFNDFHAACAAAKCFETPAIKQRPIGLAKGCLQIPADFFEPLPDDILNAFKGR